jgi:hypothetical protein
MQLSEAIALGLTLTNFNPDSWCQCAVGLAAHAIGRTVNYGWTDVVGDFPILKEEFAFPAIGLNKSRRYHESEGPFRAPIVGERRPMWFVLSHLAWAVQEGRITIEQLVDWVRSVEPAPPQTQSLREEAVYDTNFA